MSIKLADTINARTRAARRADDAEALSRGARTRGPHLSCSEQE